jgi:RecA-family ATPase
MVDGWLADGTVAVVTSEPGCGKTTLALALANAVAHGVPFAGMKTSKRPVLYLDRDNSVGFVADVLRRIKAKDGGPLWIWGGWCAEEAAEPGAGIIQTWVRSCDPKPLIVVDSLVAFHGGDENDSSETRRFMQDSRRLANLGATVLLLHHSGKSETSQDYRGSSDIKASPDACFKLTNIGSSNRIERLRIKPFKNRFLVEPELMLRYSDGVFTRETGGGSQRKTNVEKLEELLRDNPGVNSDEFEKLAPTRGVSRNYARNWLKGGVQDGSIEFTKGPKNSKLHTWVSFRVSGEDETPF